MTNITETQAKLILDKMQVVVGVDGLGASEAELRLDTGEVINLESASEIITSSSHETDADLYRVLRRANALVAAFGLGTESVQLVTWGGAIVTLTAPDDFFAAAASDATIEEEEAGHVPDGSLHASLVYGPYRLYAANGGTDGNSISLEVITDEVAAGPSAALTGATAVAVTAQTLAAVASMTTAFPGNNNDLTFTASDAGAGGNAIRIRYVDPAGNDQLLGVVVAGNDITVNLATNGGGAITSTASQVGIAVNNEPAAAALVSQDLADGDGSGVVTALAYTNLTGGDGPLTVQTDYQSVVPYMGVLLDDDDGNDLVLVVLEEPGSETDPCTPLAPTNFSGGF